jgi:hypothetical protein
MTLTLQLPPEIEKKLLERAVQVGQSMEGLALKFIEEALGINGGSDTSHVGKRFDDLLAPVRQGWEESGLSDDQVDQLFEDTLQKVRTEKRKGTAP